MGHFDAILPTNYADWRSCITNDCGIAIDAEFCQARLAALNNAGDIHTQRFIALFGKDHRRRVVGFLERALRELERVSG